MNFKEFPYQKWKASNNNLHPRTCLIHYAEVLEGRIYKGPHLGDSAIRFLVFFFRFLWGSKLVPRSSAKKRTQRGVIELDRSRSIWLE